MSKYSYSIDPKFKYALPQSGVVPFRTKQYKPSEDSLNGYCIRAVCEIDDIKSGKRVGEVTGYDKIPSIASGAASAINTSFYIYCELL